MTVGVGDGTVVEVQVDATVDGNDGEFVLREFGGLVEEMRDDGAAVKVRDGQLDGRYGGEKLGARRTEDFMLFEE